MEVCSVQGFLVTTQQGWEDMSKLRTGTKYAIINSYYKLAIPVSLLEKILELGVLVDLTWDDVHHRETVKKVEFLDNCKFIDGNEIDLVIAQQKLAGEKI